VSQVIEAHKQSTLDNKDGGLVFEIYADRLRAAVEIGWYLVDILIRLGLIGTIVGFILILGALSSGPAPTPENIQTLLISMSGGMGTALYTTLAGLVTAMVLGAQYMVLARGTEELIGKLVRIRDQANVS
jgi:biopolymer transport protein ExbB/TolQ